MQYWTCYLVNDKDNWTLPLTFDIFNETWSLLVSAFIFNFEKVFGGLYLTIYLKLPKLQ